MSETEYSRVAHKLQEISADVAVIKSNTSDYKEFREMVQMHDYQIKQQLSKCALIQAGKKESSAPWKSARMSIFVGVVMLVIGALFGILTNLLT